MEKEGNHVELKRVIIESVQLHEGSRNSLIQPQQRQTLCCLATKVALLFRFMNLGMVSRVQFERIQALYAVPTIMGYWEQLRTTTVHQLQGKQLVLAGKHCTENV